MSTMAGVSRQDGIDYPTQAPGFIPVFSGVRVAHLFSFVYIYIEAPFLGSGCSRVV
jgi:hypothetical protein